MGIHDNDPNTPNKEFAPEGWHVPSNAEWITLEEYLIANGFNYDSTTTFNKIAKAMAFTTGWINSFDLGAVGNDQSLNNSSGFNAIAVGYRSNEGTFYELIKKDEEICSILSDDEIDDIFDLNYHLKHIEEIFQRVLG